MKKWVQNRLKLIVVLIGSIVLSTLGIQANDYTKGISTDLLGSVSDSVNGCGEGAEFIMYGTHNICMDKFEASPGKDCQYQEPDNELESQINLASPRCIASSVAKVKPWRFVTQTDASKICARSGKRLPTNYEWYKVALGQTDTTSCTVDSSEVKVTGQTNCLTETGIYDMVGNVWEWTEGVVVDGKYQGIDLPDAGYVDLVDESGIALRSSTTPNIKFDSDYVSVNKSGIRGFLRGGHFSGKDDAGIFSQNLSVPPDFMGAGVGFRCVKDVI